MIARQDLERIKAAVKKARTLLAERPGGRHILSLDPPSPLYVAVVEYCLRTESRRPRA